MVTVQQHRTLRRSAKLTYLCLWYAALGCLPQSAALLHGYGPLRRRLSALLNGRASRADRPKMGCCRAVTRGFTLLELLVALALFAVLSLLTFSSLRAMIDSREQTRIEGERLAEVQMAFARLGLDIQQAVPRSIRDEYGNQLAAMSYGTAAVDAFELTVGGRRSLVPGRSGGGLQRLGYLRQEDKLLRESWPVLDRGPGLESFRQPVLSGVELFELRFLGENNEWYNHWPPARITPPGEMAPPDDRLPRAVEIIVELEDWGRLRRLFPVVTGGMP